ncbi:MAG: trigger factor [Lachnospiraceae bacterium]|nr:trigger factor [Lachnospiraceae bacterium]
MRKKMANLFNIRVVKKAFCLTLISAMFAGILSGCGNTDNTGDADTALANLATDQYVTVGDYAAFDVSVEPKQEITDEDVALYLQYVLASYPIKDDAEYTIQMGDTANINYEGKRDGVAFEGGTAEGYDLTIGSGSFIPGFEDGLIGAKIGETRDIPLTFPEDYHAEELAGAEVVFTVTVNYVYTSTMTDELAAKMNPSTPTVAEYEAYAKELLIQDAQAVYDNAVYEEITSTLMDASEVKQDAPENLVDRYFEQAKGYAQQYAAMYGMDYEAYIQALGGTVEAYEESMRVEAVNYANRMVMYQAIANAEGLSVSEEEVQTEAAETAAAAGYESADAYLETVDRATFEDYLMRTKVLEFLKERTTITEVTEEDIQEATEVLDGATAE